MMPFDLLFPELAAREVRTFLVQGHSDLPDGTYVLREFYCNEPRCDCRRVLFHIHWIEGKRVVASVNCAFEPPEPLFEDEGQVFLDQLNPQSELSIVLLELVKAMLPADQDYRARLIRHYEKWKEAVDDKTHPGHAKVRTPEHDDPDFQPVFRKRSPVRRAGPKVGLNARCPGSARKYKKCCGK